MASTNALPSTRTLKAPGGKTIQIPTVGYGTWASGDTSWAKDATLQALKAGYRHLDCAWMYGVDQAVGEAIKESGVPREELFITSKFWTCWAHPDNVELCLDKVLEGMGLEYVDLWLAHWPYATKPISREALEKSKPSPTAKPEEKGQLLNENGKPVIDWEHTVTNIAKQTGHKGSYVPTWKAMEECVRKGKAKAIGLSNFSITETQELLPHVTNIPISCNQVECHPWLPQTGIVEFAKENGIVVTCFSPFAGQKANGATLLKDEKVLKLAQKNSMDVGQLLQSWAVQRGTIPLGKSATPARIKSNLAVRKLPDEDMRALDNLEIPDGKGRTVGHPDSGLPLFTG